MFLPKAVYAQIADICYERERRGEPAYEIHKGRDQIRHIPLGAICFIPDLQLKEGDSIPQFARIQHEPVLIATDDVSTFVYIDAGYSDIQMFDMENEMSSNYEDDDYYVLVVHGLNFLFSDGLAPASPPRAKPSAPPTTGIRIDGGVATKAPPSFKNKLAVPLGSIKVGERVSTLPLFLHLRTLTKSVRLNRLDPCNILRGILYVVQAYLSQRLVAADENH